MFKQIARRIHYKAADFVNRVRWLWWFGPHRRDRRGPPDQRPRW